MGLEKMRFKNRGGLERKHYPYAHEANKQITSFNQTRAYNRSNYHKSARTTLFTWWNTTTDGVVY